MHPQVGIGKLLLQLQLTTSPAKSKQPTVVKQGPLRILVTGANGLLGQSLLYLAQGRHELLGCNLGRRPREGSPAEDEVDERCEGANKGDPEPDQRVGLGSNGTPSSPFGSRRAERDHSLANGDLRAVAAKERRASHLGVDICHLAEGVFHIEL